jgi:hypothetical protein
VGGGVGEGGGGSGGRRLRPRDPRLDTGMVALAGLDSLTYILSYISAFTESPCIGTVDNHVPIVQCLID